ncbi:MAG: glycogen/starch synthase, partial [Oscillospiraceae bacterium]|nr:glycogen/starch synthase [Oscillospiraceae bacterium]
MNILYAASEAVPYAASGGLADVAGSLPRALNKAGQDCRVVLPLYKSCKPELRAGLEFITNFTVDVGWRKQYCGVFKGEINGVTYYLLDNEYYFGRDGLYGFYDDCERFVFLS